MRVLFVHPSPLMYSEIYLRLEPLGLERVAAAAIAAGHEVRLLDLQIFKQPELMRELADFQPQAVGFSLNYLANVPEVIDLAKIVQAARKDCHVFVGGHSGSFVADELIEHGDGAIDCVLRGEGEAIIGELLEALGDAKLGSLPGVLTASGRGPVPLMLNDLDAFFQRAISDAAAINTLLACLIPAPRLSSRGGVHGIALSAAPGPSTGAAIGNRRRRPPRTIWHRSGSATSLLSMTWHLSIRSMASPSAMNWRSAK